MGICGGGANTSSTTTTIKSEPNDPEAARRMAAVAERAAAMSEQQWAMMTPYVDMLINENMGVLPSMGEYQKKELEAQTSLLPERTAATRAALEESVRDIELGRGVKDKLREQQLAELEASSPIVDKFYSEIEKGVDVNSRIGRAQADFSMSYSDQEQQFINDSRARGIDTASPEFQKELRKLRESAVSGVSAARTNARLAAEQENLSKLALGMQTRGRSTGLPGTGDYSQAGFTASNPNANTAQLSGFNAQQGQNTAAQLLGTATSANSAGMQRFQTGGTSNSEWTGGDSGMGSLFGGAMQLGASYMMNRK